MQVITNRDVENVYATTQTLKAPTTFRYLLIDDDPIYRTIVEATAESMNLSLTSYGSISEMGYFARIKEFSAVLLDYNMEHLNGLEIAEYIDTFFRDIPVVLVTGCNTSKLEVCKLPQCVREVLSKSMPVKEIISTIVGLCERQSYLKSLG